MSNEDYIKNPDRPLDSTGAKRIHTQWLRNVAAEYGLDAKRLVMGSVLSSIIGDDENCFGYLSDIDNTSPQKSEILLRTILEWEIGVPELPYKLVFHIKSIKNKLFEHSWLTSQDISDAHALWVKEIKKFTEVYLDRSSVCGEAWLYYSSQIHILSKPWTEYLLHEGYFIPRDSAQKSN